MRSEGRVLERNKGSKWVSDRTSRSIVLGLPPVKAIKAIPPKYPTDEALRSKQAELNCQRPMIKSSVKKELTIYKESNP
jgi:hypothetical protein